MGWRGERHWVIYFCGHCGVCVLPFHTGFNGTVEEESFVSVIGPLPSGIFCRKAIALGCYSLRDTRGRRGDNVTRCLWALLAGFLPARTSATLTLVTVKAVSWRWSLGKVSVHVTSLGSWRHARTRWWGRRVLLFQCCATTASTTPSWTQSLIVADRVTLRHLTPSSSKSRLPVHWKQDSGTNSFTPQEEGGGGEWVGGEGQQRRFLR